MTVKIVTDSTMTIDSATLKELDVTVVPLSFSIDGVIYTDGDLSLSEYLDKMKSAEKLPKTSQPPVGVFEEVYRELASDGSQILSIHMTNSLSGTVEAARQGALISGADVTVIDSDFIDQAMTFQIVEACRLAKEGAAVSEIVDAIKHISKSTQLWVAVSTLENLVKGGRVGRVSGMIGSLLDIRVILELKDKELVQVAKGRGVKTFKKWLNEVAGMLSTSGRKVKEIAISHAESHDFAALIQSQLQKFVEAPIKVLDTTAIIATHTGPGAFALMIDYE